MTRVSDANVVENRRREHRCAPSSHFRPRMGFRVRSLEPLAYKHDNPSPVTIFLTRLGSELFVEVGGR